MFIEGLYHYSQSFDRLYEEDATNPAYLQERETIFTYISISLVLLILSVDKTIKLIYLLTKQYIPCHQQREQHLRGSALQPF